ncbi:hypothetical protein RB595_008253 [Gaeumannomyces hyphopodioides]
MQIKRVLPLALAGGVVAQNQNVSVVPLATALASQSDLTNLLAILGTQPTFLAQLSLAQNVTFLAPNNAAMDAFLNGPNATPANQTNAVGVAALLSYHVLNGTFYDADINDRTVLVNTALNLAPYSNITGGQRVLMSRTDGNATITSGRMDMARIVTSNVNFTGGTIHVINRVLTVPLNDTRTMMDMNLTAAVGAMRRASVANRVDTRRDVTMFVPSNEAFNRIGSLESNLSTEQLASIMNYHVVDGQLPLYMSQLRNQSVSTLNGAQLTFTNNSGVMFVNGARIVQPNVLTNNGVMYVIDNVLNPESTSARPAASATTGSPAFADATNGPSGVPFTSGIAGPEPTQGPGPGNGGSDGNPGSGNGGNNGGGSNGGNGGNPSGGARSAASPSSSVGTGVAAVAALFGAAALFASW